MSIIRELRHIQTPAEQRDGLWWFYEHALAERSVTLAADMLEHAPNEFMHDVASRLLDQRLDHLEECEDRCDAILDKLRDDRPHLAEAATLHFFRGRTWASVADEVGVPCNRLRGRLLAALSGYKVAAHR